MIPCELNPAATKRFATSAGLAQAEVHVGRERLGGPQEPGELGVLQRWGCAVRVAADRREVVPVRAELTERPVLGDRVRRTRASPRFERAHHQPAGVVPRVEGAVQRAHQRQEVVRALDRIGRDVDVLGGVERHRHADRRGEVAGPQPAREHHGLGLDVAA